MSCIAPRCSAAREVGALFCKAHLAFPPGQRGGWLSAYRRQLARGNSPEQPLDASNVARRLWVGGRPPLERDLPDFDVLVLCAREIQPAMVAFARTVIRVPLPDAELTGGEIRRAVSGGKLVGKSLAAGCRVLVTCAMGINRSALVASIGLGTVNRLTADQLIALMRRRRHPDALGNEHFQKILRALYRRRG